MLKEIIHLDDETEARRILMRLGNGLPQVDTFIEEWKAAKEASIQKTTIVQKVVTKTKVEEQSEEIEQVKVV